jgi:hypothetical protein
MMVTPMDLRGRHSIAFRLSSFTFPGRRVTDNDIEEYVKFRARRDLPRISWVSSKLSS